MTTTPPRSLSTAWLGGGTSRRRALRRRSSHRRPPRWRRSPSLRSTTEASYTAGHGRPCAARQRRKSGPHRLRRGHRRIDELRHSPERAARWQTTTHDIGDLVLAKLPAEPPPVLRLRTNAASAEVVERLARDCEPRHRCRSDEAPVSQGARRLADRGGGRTATGATTRPRSRSVGPSSPALSPSRTRSRLRSMPQKTAIAACTNRCGDSAPWQSLRAWASW